MKREKVEQKEAKKKRSRFDKYGGRIADTVKVIVFFYYSHHFLSI